MRAQGVDERMINVHHYTPCNKIERGRVGVILESQCQSVPFICPVCFWVLFRWYVNVCLYLGCSPKLCTTGVTSIGKIKNGQHFFSHMASAVSGKTSGLWKWTTKWCNMLKCKDKLAKHHINCKKNNSSIQMHKLTFIWQSMVHYISSRYPCHMWLWMGSTNQITLYTHNKAISQLRHV